MASSLGVGMLNKTSQELQALYKNSPLSVEQKIRAQELEIELAEQILNFYDVMSAKLLSIKKTDGTFLSDKEKAKIIDLQHQLQFGK